MESYDQEASNQLSAFEHTQRESYDYYNKAYHYEDLKQLASYYEFQLEREQQKQNVVAFRRMVEDSTYNYQMNRPQNFHLTAYTLDPAENGYYGTISAAQYELEGVYLPQRYIAVDPDVIPYHSKVYIEFPEKDRYIEFHGEMFDLNGEYTAVDCGSAIKGNRIDLFVGGDGPYYDDVSNLIGRKDVIVYYPK